MSAAKQQPTANSYLPRPRHLPLTRLKSRQREHLEHTFTTASPPPLALDTIIHAAPADDTDHTARIGIDHWPAARSGRGQDAGQDVGEGGVNACFELEAAEGAVAEHGALREAGVGFPVEDGSWLLNVWIGLGGWVDVLGSRYGVFDGRWVGGSEEVGEEWCACVYGKWSQRKTGKSRHRVF